MRLQACRLRNRTSKSAKTRTDGTRSQREAAMAIVSYSGTLLDLSRKACFRSISNSQEAFVSIVLATTSVEGFFNEIVLTAKLTGRGSPLADIAHLIGSTERMPLIAQVQLAHFLFLNRKLDGGTQPFQDLTLLIRIRNSIVHLQPERFDLFESDPKPNKLVQQLINRKIIAPSKGRASSLKTCLRDPSIAIWAYNTSIQTRQFLWSILPERSELKRQMSVHLDGQTELRLTDLQLGVVNS